MYKVQAKELKIEITGNEASIIKYKGTESDIILPSEITFRGKTYPITRIKSTAFEGKKITNIKIPDSIQILDPCTFEENKELKSVELSKNIKKIPSHCFYKCLNLEEINLENIETIGVSAFAYCKNLNNIVINNCNVFASGFVYANINYLRIKDDSLLDNAITSSHIGILKVDNTCDIKDDNNIVIEDIIIAENASISLNHVSGIYYINNFGGKLYLIDSENPVQEYNIKTYDELIKEGYNEMQINQILLGYNDYIMLNAACPETPNEIFRLLREKNKIDAIETQKILNVCRHKQDKNNILKLLENIKTKPILDSSEIER